MEAAGLVEEWDDNEDAAEAGDDSPPSSQEMADPPPARFGEEEAQEEAGDDSPPSSQEMEAAPRGDVLRAAVAQVAGAAFPASAAGQEAWEGLVEILNAEIKSEENEEAIETRSTVRDWFNKEVAPKFGPQYRDDPPAWDDVVKRAWNELPGQIADFAPGYSRLRNAPQREYLYKLWGMARTIRRRQAAHPADRISSIAHDWWSGEVGRPRFTGDSDLLSLDNAADQLIIKFLDTGKEQRIPNSVIYKKDGDARQGDLAKILHVNREVGEDEEPIVTIQFEDDGAEHVLSDINDIEYAVPASTRSARLAGKEFATGEGVWYYTGRGKGQGRNALFPGEKWMPAIVFEKKGPVAGPFTYNLFVWRNDLCPRRDIVVKFNVNCGSLRHEDAEPPDATVDDGTKIFFSDGLDQNSRKFTTVISVNGVAFSDPLSVLGRQEEAASLYEFMGRNRFFGASRPAEDEKKETDTILAGWQRAWKKVKGDDARPFGWFDVVDDDNALLRDYAAVAIKAKAMTGLYYGKLHARMMWAVYSLMNQDVISNDHGLNAQNFILLTPTNTEAYQLEHHDEKQHRYAAKSFASVIFECGKIFSAPRIKKRQFYKDGSFNHAKFMLGVHTRQRKDAEDLLDFYIYPAHLSSDEVLYRHVVNKREDQITLGALWQKCLEFGESKVKNDNLKRAVKEKNIEKEIAAAKDELKRLEEQQAKWIKDKEKLAELKEAQKKERLQAQEQRKKEIQQSKRDERLRAGELEAEKRFRNTSPQGHALKKLHKAAEEKRSKRLKEAAEKEAAARRREEEAEAEAAEEERRHKEAAAATRKRGRGEEAATREAQRKKKQKTEDENRKRKEKEKKKKKEEADEAGDDRTKAERKRDEDAQDKKRKKMKKKK